MRRPAGPLESCEVDQGRVSAGTAAGGRGGSSRGHEEASEAAIDRPACEPGGLCAKGSGAADWVAVPTHGRTVFVGDARFVRVTKDEEPSDADPLSKGGWQDFGAPSQARVIHPRHVGP